ncbi:MAG TPA: hypothetical protein VFY67_10775 [Pyrinomonadaceae bacterium]|nr:hypothetical protein [Pyrinomonadaceae bacterium]
MLHKVCSFLVLLTLCAAGLGQDGTKSIKSEEYLTKRPASSNPDTRAQGLVTRGGGNRSQPATRSHVYSVDKSFPGGPPPRDQEYVRIGVTIWRFSAGQCPIPDCPVPAGGQKGLVDTSGGVRADDSSAFSTGERVRLALESLSHDGFVYIIDREKFADNTFGDPYLIFPTRNIYNGNNYARPGSQIHLPRAQGCFCVKSRNPQKVLVADNLIVVVSPQPLLSSEEIGAREIPLPAKLAKYISRADKEPSHRGTLKDSVGLVQTPAELNAGTKGLFDTQPALTQNDLPPQNFYQSLVPRGVPAVFSVYLRYDTKR